MNPRLALRFVIAALLIGSLIITTGVALTRWANSLPVATPPGPAASSLAMPIPDGVGHQVVNGVELAYELSPFPPRAGKLETLALIAQSYKTRAFVPVTPTLEVASADAVEGRLFTCQRDSGGGWRCPGVFFPAAGGWRMRVRVQGVFPDEDYVTLIALNVPRD